MKRLRSLVQASLRVSAALLLALGCTASLTAVAHAADDEAGFKSLFNGKDLTG
ncbi:MAG: hypothetical protein JSS02_10110, partial [Planctomycetes bacterium]|nr:hypothetical protein [Planctomycetota bacterium]